MAKLPAFYLLGAVRRGLPLVLSCAALITAFTAAPAAAQIPDKFENLQVLPKDISRDSLVEVMRQFSLQLGVRCRYCHVPGGDDLAYSKDDDEDKRKARVMLQMVQDINARLATLPERDSPPVEVSCKTCHRRRARPLLLTDEMRIALDRFGPDSAVARYERFRENFQPFGWFDFGEWEMNTLGERLAKEGRTSDAIAIYELNARYYPQSTSIYTALGQLHETEGDTAAAIRSYERAVELEPRNDVAKQRLAALRGGGA